MTTISLLQSDQLRDDFWLLKAIALCTYYIGLLYVFHSMWIENSFWFLLLSVFQIEGFLHFLFLSVRECHWDGEQGKLSNGATESNESPEQVANSLL